VSFVTITLCVASQEVFVLFISLSIQYRNFWIYTHSYSTHCEVKIVLYQCETEMPKKVTNQ
jgi:hypothetical protein